MNKEEDILNVTGSMFDTMLDYVDNSNKELEQLQQENKQLKDNWNKLKEYCKENLYFYNGLQNEDLETDTSIQDILKKMQELEKGDSNE